MNLVSPILSQVAKKVAGELLKKGFSLVQENYGNKSTELTETTRKLWSGSCDVSLQKKGSFSHRNTLCRWQSRLVSVSETSHVTCKNRSHLKLCEDKTFHCTQNTANQKAAINLPCSGSDYYLIETHDILGCTARIDRGKDGFLGEREELEERGAGWRYCKISNGDNNGDLEGSMHYKALVEDLPSTEGSPHEGLLSLPTEGSMGGQQGGR